jgi:deazaflavin-dependent oxidoreductase (nitroreductase family)
MDKTGNQKPAAMWAMFVMKMTNATLSVMLRSPFHGRVSATLLLLTFRGRKSGKKYRFPVGYMQDGGGTLVVLTPKMRTWWKNFRAGGPVSVYVQGKMRVGVAEVVLDDEDAVAEGIRTFLRRNPKATPMYRVELNAAGEPTLETLQRAVVNWVVVRIRLEA